MDTDDILNKLLDRCNQEIDKQRQEVAALHDMPDAIPSGKKRDEWQYGVGRVEAFSDVVAMIRMLQAGMEL